MQLGAKILCLLAPLPLALLGAAAALSTQEGFGRASFQRPEPTAEHEWLKARIGTWDCVLHCELSGAPARASEICRAFGDFWIVADLEGSSLGAPFRILALSTYDPAREKYVTTWHDTRSPAPMVMEGTMDAAGRKLICKGEGPDLEGAILEFTSVLERLGPDEALLTLYETAKGPKDPGATRIEYRRRR